MVCGVLSGALTIGMKDPDLDIYLVLRSMQKKFTKYLETGRLTFTKHALLQHNSITQEYTTHPLFVVILALTLLTTS